MQRKKEDRLLRSNVNVKERKERRVGRKPRKGETDISYGVASSPLEILSSYRCITFYRRKPMDSLWKNNYTHELHFVSFWAAGLKGTISYKTRENFRPSTWTSECPSVPSLPVLQPPLLLGPEPPTGLKPPLADGQKLIPEFYRKSSF